VVSITASYLEDLGFRTSDEIQNRNFLQSSIHVLVSSSHLGISAVVKLFKWFYLLYLSLHVVLEFHVFFVHIFSLVL
jgi:hypothetical protein